MVGAIAAGHPQTAQVGADVLASGGNAVDACVAAAYASWVTESAFTSPAAGGFMLVHRAADRSTRVLDFFAAVPGAGREGVATVAADEIAVRFAGSDTEQMFLIGAGACALPGAALGVEAAQRAFGSMPLRELAAPAAALAHGGYTVTAGQAAMGSVLEPILGHTPEGRDFWGAAVSPVAGDVVRLHALGDTIERLAAVGAGDLYRGELARAIVAHVPTISLDDLAAYRVVRRRPVAATFRDHTVLSNPPPSSGGVLIAYGLALLDRLGSVASETIVDVMREQARVRAEPAFLRGLYRGGLGTRILSEGALADGVRRVTASAGTVRERPAAAGTTHISVIDAAGNAAALTCSTGSGSGVVVPGTGIHMNNMLGEADLAAVPGTPGTRLTSMMAPTLAVGGNGRLLVVGSAGSARLRGAIMQVVVNALAHELDLREAIERPRIHVDEGDVHLEGGVADDVARLLATRGDPVVRWRHRDLYFGGAAAVQRRGDGTFEAAGDPRRGGCGIVVG